MRQYTSMFSPTEPASDSSSIGSIAVFRAMRLGDMLCAVPALRALRGAFPHARVTLISLPWARELAARFGHYVDDFLAFPGFPGLPEQSPRPADLPGFFEDARRRAFDLAIQLHGSGGITNPLVAALGARQTAGFYLPGEYCPDEELFFPYPAHGHEIQRLLSLLAFLGIPSQGDRLEFPLAPSDRTPALPPGGYACLHPGAAAASKRWQPARFAAVGDWLARQGLEVVLTGSRDEAELTRSVAQSMHAPAIDLAGQTTLGSLAGVVAEAKLLVCNDSGVSHLAAAFRVPSVVAVLSSDPARWAPLDRQLHRPVQHLVACSPCPHTACPLDDHPCNSGLSISAVLAEIQDLLLKERVHAA